LAIAHNLVISFYRSHKDTLTFEEWETQAGGPTPESAAEMAEREIVIREAILKLKPHHRQVVLLRFIEELSHAEVAALLGKNEATVRVVQHRALQELRQLITEGLARP
jgi:RNA polymerase sigma-70 factor (ECF subfamily)